MERILFDLYSAQPVGNTRFHGGGEYIKTVFMKLSDMNNGSYEITVFYDPAKYVDEYIKEEIKRKKIRELHIKGYTDVEDILNKAAFDVFYSGIPYFYNETCFPESIVTVGTFHGLRSIEKYTDRVEFYYYSGVKVLKPVLKRLLVKYRIKDISKRYLASMSKFDRIITDSEHTKYAILNFFPALKDKSIKVLYAPAKIASDIGDKYELEMQSIGKFILTIGCNRWEKNSVRTIVAIDNLFSNGYLDNYCVITLGGIPYKLQKRIKNREKFIQKGYVETEFMEALYKYCDIFVYGSLNEGFGLPPFEAMKYGKTCVVSAVCSLTELCGDAVYYCNPYDIGEIANRVLRASREKIEEHRVLDRYYAVKQKQDDDLLGICEYIVKGC